MNGTFLWATSDLVDNYLHWDFIMFATIWRILLSVVSFVYGRVVEIFP